MAFTLQKAIRRKIALLFGIAGASGSGKTLSALLLATGIIKPGERIAVIDTEAGRALHYAPPPGQAADGVKTFDFDHMDFPPPFTPERYAEAVAAAVDAGAAVVIVDSMSHEWDGEGGCSDIQLAEAIRMATRNGVLDEGKIDAMTAPAWKRPKVRHKRMMARLGQVRAHIIFCLRAQEKIRIVNRQVEQLGFMPICEKNFMFEMSGSMTLHPETPGEPRYDLPRKLNDELQAIFPAERRISAEAGRRLAAWAEVGVDKPAPDRATTAANLLIDRIATAVSVEALKAITVDPKVIEQRAWLREKRPELSERVDAAVSDALSLFDDGGGDDAAASADDAAQDGGNA